MPRFLSPSIIYAPASASFLLRSYIGVQIFAVDMLKSLARPWFRISAILYPEVLDPEQVVKGLSGNLILSVGYAECFLFKIPDLVREGCAPLDHREYFNMKHASARNVVEHCFGLLKMRWAMLRSPLFYPIQTQCE
ncbi:uncharacterized protein LOC117620325 isoform X1 [Prunus dulcis]|uniref:uncharacterized protein LOC117620325 isoform X1 n=1 Tax=Prunus dulcis TaxID=3755 RepID=UPI0014829DC8|nr:uncharacterized protein LOC117620325 isoform X1 [Prunus dulcis]